MTPEKSKRPLPSSTSRNFPDQRRTLQQWKLALNNVKNLYNRGQWKDCVRLCDQLLLEQKSKPHQLHASYLHFYAASSTEAIARQMYTMSISRIQTFEMAKSSYKAAISSLPQPEPLLPWDESEQDFFLSIPPSPTDPQLDNLPITASEPSTSSTSPSSVFSTESDEYTTEGENLKPSPLQIRKASGPAPSTIHHPPTPPLSPSPNNRTPSPSPISATTTLDATTIWLHNCTLERYNDHLADFSALLTKHISTIESLVQTTREAQSTRCSSRRLASYSADEQEARVADLRERIARLKGGGWRRERFEPERYRELCAVVLGEL